MSVDFDPVRLGTRRRRVDPLKIGVAVVVVALAVAVVKPWEADGLLGGPEPSAAIVTASAAPTAPSASSSVIPASTAPVAAAASAGGPPPTWAQVRPVIRAHDEWGIRAILVARRPDVRQPPTPRYEERWSRTAPHPDGLSSAYTPREDQSMVGLGITFPAGFAAQDARIWQVHTRDRLEWIDARPIGPGDDPDGAFTFARFGPDGTGFETWPAGRYRVDILAADGLYRITLQIPGRFGSVPDPDDWPVTETGLVGPDDSDPSAIRIGAFATVDGAAVPLAAKRSTLLSEEEAWRNDYEDGGGQPGGVIGSAYLPRATGLGVMLTSHASVQLALVQRIAPDALFIGQPTLGGVSRIQGRTPYVAFAVLGGGAWPPGVYAITVRWTDLQGLHEETWQVALRPGPRESPVVTD